MQQPTAGHFGGQHRGKTIGVLVAQQPVIQHPRRVEDPFQPHFIRRELGKEGTHCRFISHIDLGDLDLNAFGRQLVNPSLLTCRGDPPPAQQDELASPLRA